jgi:hypothetical protein
MHAPGMHEKALNCHVLERGTRQNLSSLRPLRKHKLQKKSVLSNSCIMGLSFYKTMRAYALEGRARVISGEIALAGSRRLRSVLRQHLSFRTCCCHSSHKL